MNTRANAWRTPILAVDCGIGLPPDGVYVSASRYVFQSCDFGSLAIAMGAVLGHAGVEKVDLLAYYRDLVMTPRQGQVSIVDPVNQ